MDMPIDKSGHKIEKLTVIAQIESVKVTLAELNKRSIFNTERYQFGLNHV
jgi:hypothetical protein